MSLAPKTSMRPKPRPSSLAPTKSMRPQKRPADLAEQAEISATVARGNRAADREGADLPENMKKMAKGGKVSKKEGTAKDMREDKAMAKKRGMSMKEWEKSAADKKHDAPKKMAKGGSVRGTGAAIRGTGFSGTY